MIVAAVKPCFKVIVDGSVFCKWLYHRCLWIWVPLIGEGYGSSFMYLGSRWIILAICLAEHIYSLRRVFPKTKRFGMSRLRMLVVRNSWKQ